jgi:hypothetical protein
MIIEYIVFLIGGTLIVFGKYYELLKIVPALIASKTSRIIATNTKKYTDIGSVFFE